jgi:hypothetical protein
MSRLLGASALALSITASSFAFGGDTSTAEYLFQQGLDAMKRNQFKEACDAFAGSNEADASPGTEMNLALCNEKQNKLATAWGWYRTAAGLAELRNQKDRAELARAEAAKLEPKLHKLVISVKSPAEGLVVTRNGAAVSGAVLGTDVPIDPGEYSIEVNAKGKVPWKQNVHIAAGPGLDRVEVPALTDAPVEAKPVAGTPGADYVPPASGGRDGTGQRNIGLVVGGAGIVAAIVAVSLEFLAISTDNKRKDAQNAAAAFRSPTNTDSNRVINAENQDKAAVGYDKAAKNDQLAAIVTGAGAVVLLGVGVTLILTAPSSSKSADLTKPRIYPMLGNGTGGLGLTGSF